MVAVEMQFAGCLKYALVGLVVIILVSGSETKQQKLCSSLLKRLVINVELGSIPNSANGFLRFAFLFSSSRYSSAYLLCLYLLCLYLGPSWVHCVRIIAGRDKPLNSPRFFPLLDRCL